MALLEGTVKHPNGDFEITLDTVTKEFDYDPFFEMWFKPGTEVRGPDNRPIDRALDPEKWLRALAIQFRHHPLVIEEVSA